MKLDVASHSEARQKLVRRVWSPGGIFVGLVLVTLAIYLPVINNDFVAYDDPGYVTENLVVRRGLTWSGLLWAFQNVNQANWHPVTWLSHMLDCTLFGLNPVGHHVVSVLGHAVNAVLLFRLWWRMTGALGLSALVAALFAWHPLHVESVAWVSERKDILSTGFGLLAMLFYHRYVTERHRGSYWIAAGMFALSLMSKPMLVTLPFVLLLLDYWPLERLSWDLSRTAASGPSPVAGPESVTILNAVREKIPFFALSLACSVVTMWAQRQGGAVTSVEALSLPVRLTNVVISYAGYLGQMLWPKDLIVIYVFNFNPPAAHFWVALIVLVGISGLVVRFPDRKYLLTGWCFYLGTLVPVIGLVQAGLQAHADRYTYVPLMGIFVMLAWGSREIFSRLRCPVPVAAAFWGVLVLVCCPLTWLQAERWKNSETLFSHALVREPGNTVALEQLVDLSLRAGDFPKAMHHLQKYRQVARVSEPSAVFLAKTLSELNRPGEAMATIDAYLAATNAMTGGLRMARGAIAESAGDKARAYAEYQQAMEFKNTRFAAALRLASLKAEDRTGTEAEADYRKLLAEDPGNPSALLGLAGLASDAGRSEEAQKLLRQASVFPPHTPTEFGQVAAVQAKLGRRAEAEANYLRAIELDRWDYNLHFNLGNFYARNGVFTNAIRYLGRAAELKPTIPGARNNLAVALASVGRFQEAANQYREAIKLTPGEADPYYGLARVLEIQTNYAGAVSYYQQALQLKPNLVEARLGLAMVLSQAGQWSNALPQWELVLQASPESGVGHYQLGLVLLNLRRTAEALPHLERAVALRPRDRLAAGTLARVLATAADGALRNGARAVALAEAICQPREQTPPALLEILAAAYAESGAFAQARATVELALQAARADKEVALADRLQEQLARYQAGRPLRDGP